MKFRKGDVVRSRMTPSMAGQIIGERNWGDSFLMRHFGSEDVGEFNAVELEQYPIPADASSAASGRPDDDDESGGRPVITLADVRAARNGTRH